MSSIMPRTEAINHVSHSYITPIIASIVIKMGDQLQTTIFFITFNVDTIPS